MTRQIVLEEASPDEFLATLSEPDAVARLADAVRTIYVLCYRDATGDATYGNATMPAWDGGEDSAGRRHAPVWPRVAARIAELGADPLEYIRAQFASGEYRRRPPRPNMLYSPAAEARWRELANENTVGGLQRQLESENISLSGIVASYVLGPGWPRERALRFVLSSPALARASAVLRYVLAVENGFDDVAKMFFDGAVLKYVFRKKDYDAVLGDRIPLSLRQEADRVRSQFGIG